MYYISTRDWRSGSIPVCHKCGAGRGRKCQSENGIKYKPRYIHHGRVLEKRPELPPAGMVARKNGLATYPLAIQYNWNGPWKASKSRGQ